MEQTNHIGIVLKAADYKDNDKIIRIFTVDEGIISAVMRGVKKNSAKLKFAAQPFAFCEYTIIKRVSGLAMVINASQKEDMFALTQDTDVFFNASLMAEATDAAMSLEYSADVFVLLLRCFKEMMYKNLDADAMSTFYLYMLLKHAGLMKKPEIILEKDQADTSDEFIILLSNSTPDNLPKATGKVIKDSQKRIIKEFEKRFEVFLKSKKLL